MYKVLISTVARHGGQPVAVHTVVVEFNSADDAKAAVSVLNGSRPSAFKPVEVFQWAVPLF